MIDTIKIGVLPGTVLLKECQMSREMSIHCHKQNIRKKVQTRHYYYLPIRRKNLSIY